MTHYLMYALAALVFLFFLYAARESSREKEQRAFRRFMLLAVILPVPFLLVGFFTWSVGSWILAAAVVVVAGIFFVPRPVPAEKEHIVPRGRLDERDTMFSRDILEPGSDEYRDYYSRHPERQEGDDAFRRNPGLLSENALFYDPFVFPAARANFDLIEKNRDFVDGPVASHTRQWEAKELSARLKQLAIQYGAVSAGITRLEDYHLYSYRGRRHNYGEAVDNRHTHALALTVEMDHDYVRNAPYAYCVLESSRQYVRSGILAVWLAQLLRDMGYPARAHIDGEYEVVCPLVARDAGLGEIGRMGLLMTPELGPRVRIAVVTTSAPLVEDSRDEDPSVIDFCLTCKKCADVCPSRAISFDDRREINGVLRWQIDQQACFTYWTKAGTDCARCMSVCPYSHPHTPLHNLVRHGIRHSPEFRKLAVSMDDYFYGRRPTPVSVKKS